MAKQQPPTFTDIPARLPGESDQDHCRRVEAWIAGEDVRTKTDLRDWTRSLPFHIDRSRDKTGRIGIWLKRAQFTTHF